MGQFLVGKWPWAELADAEGEEAPVVGRQVDRYVDFLALLVGLGDDVFGVPSGVHKLWVFLVIRIPTNAALAVIPGPLGTKTATVQLVVSVMFWGTEAKPPGSVSAGWVDQPPVAENDHHEAQSEDYLKRRSAESHGDKELWIIPRGSRSTGHLLAAAKRAVSTAASGNSQH